MAGEYAPTAYGLTYAEAIALLENHGLSRILATGAVDFAHERGVYRSSRVVVVSDYSSKPNPDGHHDIYTVWL